jgi:hypothetical protein
VGGLDFLGIVVNDVALDGVNHDAVIVGTISLV